MEKDNERRFGLLLLSLVLLCAVLWGGVMLRGKDDALQNGYENSENADVDSEDAAEHNADIGADNNRNGYEDADSGVGGEAVGTAEGGAGGETEKTGEAEQAAAEYLAACRMERDRSRAEQLELLQKLISDQTGSEEARTQAEQQRLQVSSAAAQESSAESLLAAEGFGETVVLKSSDRATVVCAVELTAVTAARVAEIVSEACSLNFENVVIVNRSMI